MISRKGALAGMPTLALFFLLAAPVCGQSFYGAGTSLLPQSSPKPTGWAVFGTLASSKGQIWSVSEVDFTRGTGKLVQSSVRTGIATPMRSFGPVTIYVLGDAGAATVGSNSSAAFGTGSVALIPIRKSGYSVMIGFRAIQSAVGGLQQTVEIGFGKVVQ